MGNFDVQEGAWYESILKEILLGSHYGLRIKLATNTMLSIKP